MTSSLKSRTEFSVSANLNAGTLCSLFRLYLLTGTLKGRHSRRVRHVIQSEAQTPTHLSITYYAHGSLWESRWHVPPGSANSLTITTKDFHRTWSAVCTIKGFFEVGMSVRTPEFDTKQSGTLPRVDNVDYQLYPPNGGRLSRSSSNPISPTFRPVLPKARFSSARLFPN